MIRVEITYRVGDREVSRSIEVGDISTLTDEERGKLFGFADPGPRGMEPIVKGDDENV